MNWLTVRDVLQVPPGEARDARLRQWSASVWAAWAAEHDHVRALVESVLAD